MRRLLLILPILGLMLTGCMGGAILFEMSNVDGYYTGWIRIDNPGYGFDRSFRAELRLWDNGNRARLWDEWGRSWTADYVDYDFLSDRVDVYLRVRESDWDPYCGYEVYDWEIRMSGRIRSGDRFEGDIHADLDPDDYWSDHCYLDFDPPPKYVGTFDLDHDYGPGF